MEFFVRIEIDIQDQKFIEAVESLDKEFSFYVTIKGKEEPVLKAYREEHKFMLEKYIQLLFEILSQTQAVFTKDGKYTIELRYDYPNSVYYCECFQS